MNKLPNDWNRSIRGSRNRTVEYTSPADVYMHSASPILTRRKHNGYICAVCGLRLGDFGRLSNVRTRALNTVLFRRAAASAITLQAVADTINMIKGDRAVNLEWVIKFFRHDISDLDPQEIDGSYVLQTLAYSRRISEKRATQVIAGMKHVIRQRIANGRLRNLGVIPAGAMEDVKTPAQLEAELNQSVMEAAEASRVEHMDKIKSNKVQILGGLLRRD